MPNIGPKYTQSICPRYLQPKIYQRYTKDMPKIGPRYTKDMPKISSRYIFHYCFITLHFSVCYRIPVVLAAFEILTCYLYFCRKTVAVLEADKSEETFCRSFCLLLEIAFGTGQVISGQEIVFLCPNMINIKGKSSNCRRPRSECVTKSRLQISL